MSTITEAEQQALEQGLDTAAIMRAVDAISRLRGDLAADESPTVGDQLLELHRLALAVHERAAPTQVRAFFALASDLEIAIDEWRAILGAIQATLSAALALFPERMAYGQKGGEA